MSVNDLRKHFASRPDHKATADKATADILVKQLGDDFRRLPQRGGWTRRAVWYENDEVLLAIVGEQEAAQTDIVLAHGLFLAQGRPLRLVLPERWAYPSRFRQPWLKADLEIWTHANDVLEHPKPLTKNDTRAAAGGFEAKRAYTLGAQASEWVRDLIEWATQHPDLVEAHTSSMRGWSHNGQRVLTIKGKRSVEIKAGVDAKTLRADTHTLAAAPDPATFAGIRKRVEQGIKHARAKEFGRFEEHHLQVILRRSPATLLLEHPVLREVPAWRPGGGSKNLGRGFIDLVGLDGSGDVVIVETKLDSDDLLIFQGLDYWIWATNPANHDWLCERLYADPKAPIRLLYAVAGKGGAQPTLGRYELAHLELLDEDIPWRFALLSDWNSGAPPHAEMLPPRTIPH